MDTISPTRSAARVPASTAARTAATHASMADAVKDALDQAADIATGDDDLDASDARIISDNLLNLEETDDTFEDDSSEAEVED